MARVIIKGTPNQCTHIQGITIYKCGDEYIARTAHNDISDAERKRLKEHYDATIKNLQRVWKAFNGGLKGLFTIREGRQLDYHRFLSLNLNPPVVELTPGQAARGVTVAGPYWVSQGRLRPEVEVKVEEGLFVAGLNPGELGPRDQLRFISLKHIQGGMMEARSELLDLDSLTLRNGRICMPRREGQWGTFVLMRRQRDGSMEVSTQRLVG